MKWHKGPPPEIGWWPASVFQDKEVIRWWDGQYWSAPALKEMKAKTAASLAQIKHPSLSKHIKWTDRWWL